MPICYKCGVVAHKLSPRSRCVTCEYQSNVINELENENLREAIEMQSELKEQWKRLAYILEEDLEKVNKQFEQVSGHWSTD